MLPGLLRSSYLRRTCISFLEPLLPKDLKTTDLLLAHGLKDTMVPPSHSAKLELAYKGAGRVRRLTSTTAGHNLAFYDLKEALRSTLLEWL